ncbi:MAG: acylneuraminate cytidylyltransferase family protein [Bacteroidaceae bacterium]|nr:acylneuraminate cytidylyltransferase family protein [Bacteroidaceae bacterium]MBR7166542.1 acylneuraminate cytidylyltransferase family protein [Bacteroidaceae bacterium]
MKAVAFVPIRLNSKRVVGKNLKLLGDKPLLQYILETLVKVPQLTDIYVYCSQESIIPYLPKGVKFLKRDTSLDSDETLGCEIYEAFTKAVDADVYMLAHTTSPFIKPSTISNALDKVINNNHDSAFSAQKIQTFTWYNGKPLNYNLNEIPRTQTIEPIYVETSAFYIFRREVWTESRQRIGERPYMAIVDTVEGVDIDNPEDFDFATKIVSIGE